MLEEQTLLYHGCVVKHSDYGLFYLGEGVILSAHIAVLQASDGVNKCNCRNKGSADV